MCSVILMYVFCYLVSMMAYLTRFIKDISFNIIYYMYVMILVFDVVYVFTTGQIKDVSITLVGVCFLSYTILCHVTKLLLDKYFERSVFDNPVVNILPRIIGDFRNNLYLYENGITARKYTLSSELSSSEEYKEFCKVKTIIDKQLNFLDFILNNEQGLSDFDGLADACYYLVSGVNYFDDITSKSLFESNLDTAKGYLHQGNIILYDVNGYLNNTVCKFYSLAGKTPNL